MKFVKLSFAIAAIALFGLACGETTTTTNQTANGTQPSPAASPKPTVAAPPADELADARKTFGQFCAACHGDNGDGGNVTIEGKKLKVPSLKVGHALDHTDEQMAKTITNGDKGMPSFKDRLKPEQINALIRFIHRELRGDENKAKETAPAPKN